MDNIHPRIRKLFKKVDDCMNSFDFHLATKYCQRILNLEPNNVQALEIRASIALETGDPETAKDLWLKAVGLSPNDGHTKYLSLGQLHEGKAALEYYTKGVQLMQDKLAAADSDQQLAREALRRELSTAYCAMAEIFMTDSCFEEDAEQQCRALIDKSLESDASNPEAYVCLANFLTIQGKREEAKEAMGKSLSWLPAYKAAREGSSDADPLEACPLSYDSRINMSKLLIELEMYDEASEVLGGLTEEDDEVVDCWYLLGFLNHLRGADYHGNARFYLDKALKVSRKVEFCDADILDHIQQLQQELGPKTSDDDEDEEEDKENNTMDCDGQSGQADDDDDDFETEEEEEEMQ